VFAAPVAVTVSIPPQKYFVERIGGDAVTVAVMAAKGRDPHAYEPSAAQMRHISRTELYIAVGVPFESRWLPKFQALNPAMRVVSLLEGLPRLAGKPDLALRGGEERAGRGQARHGETSHGAGHKKGPMEDHREGHAEVHGKAHGHGLETDDPHIWLSPRAMIRAIPTMTAALSAARPEQSALFEARAAQLTKETRELEARIASLFAAVPEEKRLFLTFHQSWTYYAENFGLREASVELGGREAGPKSMELLMDFALRHKIRVIVADDMTGKSSVAAIAQSIRGTATTASPLEENWPESLEKFSEALAGALAPNKQAAP
jgi:zinc transport system substrate-binding protein